MYTTCTMVSICGTSLYGIQLDGPKRGSIEWAESKLVEIGILKRRTKLKRLSAKTIAAIIERCVEAEQWRDNHECEPYYGDDY